MTATPDACLRNAAFKPSEGSVTALTNSGIFQG
jgi:hypothetical protein